MSTVAPARGQILSNRSTLAQVEHLVDVEEMGEIPLKGFARPVAAVSIVALKASVKADLSRSPPPSGRAQMLE